MMSRIRAGSFGLDIAGLLVDKHDNNDEYTHMINDLKNKLINYNNNINKDVKGMKDTINSHYSDVDNKVSDIKKEAYQMATMRDKEIENINATNEDMWNRAVPQKISAAMDKAADAVPKSTVYYRGYGQRETIDNPSPGDICWESGEWDQAGSNALKAQAYRYSANVGWQPIKSNQDIYGSNIFGAEIKGGLITGSEFRSNDQGALGAPFQVSKHGEVYARDFIMDLTHRITTEVNECSYSGSHKDVKGNVPAGLNFKGGMLHMSANVNQTTGKYVDINSGNFIGKTYMEPNYLKLRSVSPDEENTLYGRTDIRGGNIEVSDQWSQDTGVMIGYWTDNYTHGRSPEIKLANDMEIYRTGAGNMGFIAKNGFIFHQDVDIGGDSDLYIHSKSLSDYIKSVVRSMKK